MWGPPAVSKSGPASSTSTSSSASPGGFLYAWAPLTWGARLSLAHSSCTSTPSSASPGFLPTFGLASRGGTTGRGLSAAGFFASYPSQHWGPLYGRSLFARGLQQRQFATYLSQPWGPLYSRAFLARRYRQERPCPSCTPPPTSAGPGPSLVGLSYRQEKAYSSCTLPPTSASPGSLYTVGLSSQGGTARRPSQQLY